MWEIIQMLLKGNSEYETHTKESVFLAFRSPEDVAKEPSPRTLNSHYPAHLIPKGVLSNGNKIVHVQRNFKDVCVSAYNQFKPMKRINFDTFDQFLDLMLGTHGVCKYILLLLMLLLISCLLLLKY